jgi:ketosteroid isomerase-like protein
MKIRFLLALVGLAIGFTLPTFAQQTNTPDPQLRQVVDEQGAKFDKAFNNNDAAALAALYAENAILVTADAGQVYGRKAIEKYWADVLQKVHFSNHLSTPDQNSPYIIDTAGNDMMVTGKWSTTIQGQNFGPIQLNGYFSSVMVRAGDVWKDRMQIGNVTPAPAATPSPTPSSQ